MVLVKEVKPVIVVEEDIFNFNGAGDNFHRINYERGEKMKSQRKRNIINFLCLHCEESFNQDVGKINFETLDGTPEFGNRIICKRCGASDEGKGEDFSKHFELTEEGQGQLTELFLKGDE